VRLRRSDRATVERLRVALDYPVGDQRQEVALLLAEIVAVEAGLGALDADPGASPASASP
jgi:hypothetical protein